MQNSMDSVRDYTRRNELNKNKHKLKAFQKVSGTNVRIKKLQMLATQSIISLQEISPQFMTNLSLVQPIKFLTKSFVSKVYL